MDLTDKVLMVYGGSLLLGGLALGGHLGKEYLDYKSDSSRRNFESYVCYEKSIDGCFSPTLEGYYGLVFIVVGLGFCAASLGKDDYNLSQ